MIKGHTRSLDYSSYQVKRWAGPASSVALEEGILRLHLAFSQHPALQQKLQLPRLGGIHD